MHLETEIGGLLILEEMSLLKTVLVKAESVLLERNLNSCNHGKNVSVSKSLETYFDKKMNIEVSASSILFVRVLNSTSFDEINTL